MSYSWFLNSKIIESVKKGIEIIDILLTVIIQKWTTTITTCRTHSRRKSNSLKKTKDSCPRPLTILIVATRRRSTYLRSPSPSSKASTRNYLSGSRTMWTSPFLILKDTKWKSKRWFRSLTTPTPILKKKKKHSSKK